MDGRRILILRRECTCNNTIVMELDPLRPSRTVMLKSFVALEGPTLTIEITCVFNSSTMPKIMAIGYQLIYFRHTFILEKN